ncbi:alpha-hydroxy acid oxidase [Lentzea sp. NPDC034063]|uniref:alpha-hydroxy acid oxidase n=1 Tax=unclassified Lentzea TaxID=2643253 RepID=UPI00340B63D6
MDGSSPVSLADVERECRSTLPAEIWDFIAGGSGNETAMRANRAALDSVSVVPRVLAGGRRADTSSKLLRTDVAAPLAVAPMAYHRLVHPGGEVETAAAAKECGIPLVVSTLSSCHIEDIAETGAALWFQVYWLADERLVRELVRRAEDAGCQALVVTADVPVLGRRLRDIRNQFVLPTDVRAVQLADTTGDSLAHAPGIGSAVATHTASAFLAGLSWEHVRRLREWSSLPLVVKGVLDPRDAVMAVRCGADAVVVSNHGGRQLDAAPGACTQLDAVVRAVEGACEVMFDSGIRSGTDVLRALVLGAHGVLVGRPALWGLGVRGRVGVAEVMSLLRDELADALTLAGCADISQTRDLAIGKAP